jgi:hypothetical protein
VRSASKRAAFSGNAARIVIAGSDFVVERGRGKGRPTGRPDQNSPLLKAVVGEGEGRVKGRPGRWGEDNDHLHRQLLLTGHVEPNRIAIGAIIGRR